MGGHVGRKDVAVDGMGLQPILEAGSMRKSPKCGKTNYQQRKMEIEPIALLFLPHLIDNHDIYI